MVHERILIREFTNHQSAEVSISRVRQLTEREHERRRIHNLTTFRIYSFLIFSQILPLIRLHESMYYTYKS